MEMESDDLTAEQARALVHALQLRQRELEQARDKYRHLYEYAPVGYLVLDAQGRIVEANATAAGLLGLDKEDLRGRPLAQFVAAPVRTAFQRCWEALVATQTPQACHLQLSKPGAAPEAGGWTGRLRGIAVSGGERLGGRYRITLCDVTQEAVAQRQAGMLADILEATPDMVSIATLEGKVLYFNRAARRILSPAPGSDLSDWPIPRGHPDWASEIIQREGIPTALAEGIWRGRSAVLAADGRVIPVSQVIIAHKNAEGEVTHLSTIAQDTSRSCRLVSRLRAQRAQFKAIIDNAPEGIVVTDAQSRVVLANPAAERLYARPVPVGEPYASHAALALHRPDGTPYDPRELPLTRSALDGEAHHNVEMTICWPDGQERHLLVNTAPIRGPRGRLDGAVGIFQDITERKQTRAALRESRARLKALFEHAKDGILLLDSDGRILDANPAANAMAGDNAGRVRGTHMAELILEADRPWLREEWGRLLAGGEIRGEFRFTRPDGEPLVLEYHAVANILPGLHLAILRDVTQRARAEEALQRAHEELEIRVQQRTEELVWTNQVLQAEVGERERTANALRESEAQFRAVFEGSVFGIALVDQESRIIATNLALQKMLGYAEAELRAMPLSQVAFTQDMAITPPFLSHLEQGEWIGYPVERHFRRKDGDAVWGHVSVSVVSGESGAPLFSVYIVEDITARKRMEAELAEVRHRLAESQEAERLLLAQELHDGPVQELLGIDFQLEILLSGLQDADLQAQFDPLRGALRGVMHTLRQTAQELRPSTLVPFGLEPTIRAHAEEFQETYPSLSIELDLTPDGQTLPEHVRLTLFRIYQQALHNVQHHARARHVWVRFHMNEDNLQLEVEDDGVGFQLPERWVDLVRQGHLGLVGAHERAAAVGGWMEVATAPGEGTLLRVIVPRPDNGWTEE
jgi:PAS domain S-box-containing protein